MTKLYQSINCIDGLQNPRKNQNIICRHSIFLYAKRGKTLRHNEMFWLSKHKWSRINLALKTPYLLLKFFFGAAFLKHHNFLGRVSLLKQFRVSWFLPKSSLFSQVWWLDLQISYLRDRDPGAFYFYRFSLWLNWEGLVQTGILSKYKVYQSTNKEIAIANVTVFNPFHALGMTIA